VFLFKCTSYNYQNEENLLGEEDERRYPWEKERWDALGRGTS
jgi:hypothetical protein